MQGHVHISFLTFLITGVNVMLFTYFMNILLRWMTERGGKLEEIAATIGSNFLQ